MCRKILRPTAAQFESARVFSAIAETTRDDGHVSSPNRGKPRIQCKYNDLGATF